MISVRVTFVGLVARDHPDADEFGRVERVARVPEGSTVSELTEKMAKEDPRLDLGCCLIVLNDEIINGDRRLRDGDAVSYFAPIAGG
jgi:molybdopterin converting factor small subunit